MSLFAHSRRVLGISAPERKCRDSPHFLATNLDAHLRRYRAFLWSVMQDYRCRGHQIEPGHADEAPQGHELPWTGHLPDSEQVRLATKRVLKIRDKLERETRS